MPCKETVELTEIDVKLLDDFCIGDLLYKAAERLQPGALDGRKEAARRALAALDSIIARGSEGEVRTAQVAREQLFEALPPGWKDWLLADASEPKT